MGSVFALLNAGALLGWSAILCILLLRTTEAFPGLTTPLFYVDPSETPASPSFVERAPPIIYALLFLEAICWVEVGRIAAGQLKGNLVLGTVLHAIRMTCLLLVLPDCMISEGTPDSFDDVRSVLGTSVLYSWSLTEVGRYPMYLFPHSSAARYIRLVLPIFTFPAGAGAEAWGAYNVLSDFFTTRGGDDGIGGPPQVYYWVKIALLAMVVFINGVLGPTLAYPALLKKGLPVLLGKTQKEKRTKTA